jgi:predicted AlkP superfamily phosphohydrolase/phosphomutase
VVILGLDGAEWDLLGPMLDAGEMPNLARVRERGVYGKLRSLDPPQKSPAIWTTIATGKSPEEHGIRAFVEQVGGRPLTKNLRQARALWNIVSGVGRSVGIVGWLMTWPAEEVNGYIITDYLQYDASRSRKFQGRTYPPELEESIADEVVFWQDVPWSFVQRFLDAPLDTASLDPEMERLLRPMRWISAGDVTFARVGTRLYLEDPPDLFAVYLRGMDTMGHLYWNYMTPQAVPAGSLNPAVEPYVTGAMRAYYRYVDELVGPILDAALADPATTVIVCSDHGFAGGPGRGIEVHKLDGVILMAGRGIGKGEITGANVYDIAPTALVLLGLPPAQDMHGKVLWSALDESIPRDRFGVLIPTYETGDSTGTGTPLESPVDEELKERLRSLGYID